jgi:hypothetical protein
MPERIIFRKKPLEKLNRPGDLDELLQVNSAHTWLLFGAISFILIGLLIWAFMGSISQRVNGFGIIKVHDLPIEILSNQTGQIDSVFVKTGDQVESGQKLMKIIQLESQKFNDLFSPFSGEITGFNVTEGDYIKAGSPVMEIRRIHNNTAIIPEVIFFVNEKDISKLKTGMDAFLKFEREIISPEFLKYRISFIAKFPASGNTMQKYIPIHPNSHPNNERYYEVRALLISNVNELSSSDKEALMRLNGLTCGVTITVSKQTPATYFLNPTR